MSQRADPCRALDGTPTAKSPQRAYWDQRLAENWGSHGVGSLAYGRHYNRWLYRVRRHAFIDLCRKLGIDLKAARVLDVGSGTGFYLAQWRALGVRHLTGLDFSPVAVARLKRRFPDVSMVEADIGENAALLPADSFDVVGAFDVLFHIVDDERYERALQNIAGSLRQGGLFLYSDSFLNGPPKQYLDYWKARSLRDVESALDKAGFESVRRLPVFVIMNSPVDSRSLRFQRLWDLAMNVVQRSEAAGFLLGAALYPFELILRKIVSEGPSTEVMVSRKR